MDFIDEFNIGLVRAEERVSKLEKKVTRKIYTEKTNTENFKKCINYA